MRASLLVTCTFVPLLIAATSVARTPAAEAIDERTLPISASTMAPGSPPAYAADGTLRWPTEPSGAAPADCDSTTPEEALLASPPVALWRCGSSGRLLVGTRRDGTPWVRPLVYLSGTHRIDLHVGSARADGLTLNTLEVLDPATGKTLLPPPLRFVDAPPRPLPVFAVHSPVTCPLDGGACYGYNPEGPSAGLVRIERDGRMTVLEPPQRKWRAPIDTSDLQFGPGGHTLLLAETWLFRGTKWVRFAIFDLATGRRIFEQRHGEGRVVSNPRIVPGPGNQAAFFYRDATGARYVVVNYRILR
jgi:hypothetical protein